LSGIAKVQAAVGDVAGAMKIAQQIERADAHSRALSGIAEVQAAVGDVAGARETLVLALEAVQQIEDVFWRSRALNDVLKGSAALVP
jgi:superfamily II helicase